MSNKHPVPLVDVPQQFSAISGQVKQALADVVDSGSYVLGLKLAEFESAAAGYLGSAYTVGVANGTDAIVLALEALGVGAGDEVICPAFTFYATAEAVARVGATPVFADIDPQTMNIDPADAAGRITSRTKALIPVHLFGRPVDVAALRKLGLAVIEDAAQAFGAHRDGVRVGAMGEMATFSFYPTKNLFCLGDGGLVSTSNADLDRTLRLLRHHGSVAKQTFQLVGYNSRLDEMQAAVLKIFLGEIDRWNSLRRQAALRYAELGLGDLVDMPADEPGHIYHLFVCRHPERDRIVASLRQQQIGTAFYYDTPLHLQPVFERLGWRPGSLPETEQAGRDNFALPMWAGITAEQQEQVVRAVEKALA